MAARAGEEAREAGTFVCQACNEKVRVQKGHRIPRCPNGHVTHDERRSVLPFVSRAKFP